MDYLSLSIEYARAAALAEEDGNGDPVYLRRIAEEMEKRYYGDNADFEDQK